MHAPLNLSFRIGIASKHTVLLGTGSKMKCKIFEGKIQIGKPLLLFLVLGLTSGLLHYQ